MKYKIHHIPVMVEEVLEALKPEPGNIIVDGTVGEGGHSVRLAEKISPGGLLVGIDRDSDNLEIARKRIDGKDYGFELFCDAYSSVKAVLSSLEIDEVDGVLLDLGFSRRHIEEGGRGFSFLKDEIVDMRYNKKSSIPAHEWLNNASKEEIGDVLRKFGQEKEYRRIAAAITEDRDSARKITARELASLVSRVKRSKKAKIHPATKTFQAIRIFVNNELDEVRKGVSQCLKTVRKGGRLAVITYHSLEDRIVKDIYHKYSGKCTCPSGFPICRCGAENILPKIEVLRNLVLKPSEQEIKDNPSSRSAQLRVCQVTGK